MNKLKLYVVRDTLVGDNSLLLSAKNDAVLARNVKATMLSKQQNYLNTDTTDKQVFEVGELDTDTGIITGLPSPAHVFNLEDLRQELIMEYRKRKAGIDDGEEGSEEAGI